jgi:hypothetical protein
MVDAASMIISKSTASDCSGPDCTLFWLSSARRAVFSRSRVRLGGALDRVPCLSCFFDVDECRVSDPSGLFRFTCDLVRGGIKNSLDEVNRSDLSAEEKSAKRSRMHERLSSWAPKGRSFIGIAVLGEDCEPLDGDAAFGALRGHWEPVFNSGQGDIAAMNKIRGDVSSCPDGLCPVSRDEFVEICKVRRQSAPGPDGIVYAAWTACGDEAAGVLFDCYLAILDGFTPPCGLIRLPLSLSPKGKVVMVLPIFKPSLLISGPWL